MASGLGRAVFGDIGVADVDRRLKCHLAVRLGLGVDRVLFRGGRIGAVCGLRLADGADVVVKVVRPLGQPPPAGSALSAPARDGPSHLTLRW